MTEKNTLSYRDFEGSADVSLEDGCLFGKVLFIRDTIIYSGETIEELTAAFRESVDEYINDCAQLGREPNKPFSGTLQVRIGPDRHRALASIAHRRSLSINSVITDCVQEYLDARSQEPSGGTRMYQAEWETNKDNGRGWVTSHRAALKVVR